MRLKPCPFCGAEDLKHDVTAASGGGARGVVVCRSCGARLEACNHDSIALCKAGYSCDDATTYQRLHAFDAVAEKWNNRPELVKRKRIVRCRDCIHASHYSDCRDEGEWLDCLHFAEWDYYADVPGHCPVRPDFFCAHGETEDDE